MFPHPKPVFPHPKPVLFASTVVATVAAAVVALTLSRGTAEETRNKSAFASSTIDLGMIVSDAEKSAKFYTEAVGFTELKPFSVPADFATEVGLTNHQSVSVRVLVLDTGKTATKLKLIHFPGVESKKTDTAFFESQLGYRYLTIFPADMTAALERLKRAGVKPVTKDGMVPLPKGMADGVYITLVRDPDGNFVELVGTKG